MFWWHQTRKTRQPQSAVSNSRPHDADAHRRKQNITGPLRSPHHIPPDHRLQTALNQHQHQSRCRQHIIEGAKPFRTQISRYHQTDKHTRTEAQYLIANQPGEIIHRRPRPCARITVLKIAKKIRHTYRFPLSLLGPPQKEPPTLNDLCGAIPSHTTHRHFP